MPTCEAGDKEEGEEVLRKLPRKQRVQLSKYACQSKAVKLHAKCVGEQRERRSGKLASSQVTGSPTPTEVDDCGDGGSDVVLHGNGDEDRQREWG